MTHESEQHEGGKPDKDGWLYKQLELSTPSADEEIERIVFKWADIGRETDTTREESILGAIKEYSASLSQAHEKEREEQARKLRQLIAEIEPLADQIIDPKDNTFRRQVNLIKSLL